MEISIVGYGKMGHEIAKIAKAKRITYVTVDPYSEDADFKELDENSLKDIVIDFTLPASALQNLEIYAQLGKNVVMGTTGWYNQMEKAKQLVNNSEIGFIWSGNFSLGVNAFFRIVQQAAQTMDKLSEYDIFINEFHHSQKADSPSGTAEMLGHIILENVSRKDTLVTDSLNKKIKPNELHISSTRAGNIPGTHIVGFDSQADSIELRHTARNRTGFAHGAVLAAEFIHGKKGFYDINDLMNSLSGGNQNV